MQTVKTATKQVQSGFENQRSSWIIARRNWLKETGWAIATVVVAVITGIQVMRLWDADLRIPLRYWGDANFYHMLIKGILENGWYNRNPLLGAPHGQVLFDFPLGGDNLLWLMVKGMGIFTSNPPLVMNLIFIAMFGITALTAFWVLRYLTVSASIALVSSVLFAVAPFRLLRNVIHWDLTAYFQVPLTGLLVISLLSGTSLFDIRKHRTNRRFAWLTGNAALLLILSLIIGSTGLSYYTLFSLLLLAVATVVATCIYRSKRLFISGVIVIAMVGAVQVANLAPHFLYQNEHGKNVTLFSRAPAETEKYSLSISSLFVSESHHFEPLRKVGVKYAATTLLPQGGEFSGYLGLVGIFGFLASIFLVFSRLITTSTTIDYRSRVTFCAAFIIVFIFFLATAAGFASLFSYAVSPIFRGVDRIVVFLSFFSLLVVALLCERIRAKIGTSLIRRAALSLCLIGLFLFGLWDQIPLWQYARFPFIEDGRLKTNWKNDADFVNRIEQRLPKSSAVFQFPIQGFPWGAMIKMIEFDSLKGYLHSNSLRWSYGAMSGRPSDWQARLIGQPTSVIVRTAATKGFRGIMVDRAGYEDRAAGLVTELSELLRVKPFASKDDRLLFFDMRPYLDRKRRSEAKRKST